MTYNLSTFKQNRKERGFASALWEDAKQTGKDLVALGSLAALVSGCVTTPETKVSEPTPKPAPAVLSSESNITDVILYASKRFSQITAGSVVIFDGYAMSERHKDHFNDVIGLMAGTKRAVMTEKGNCGFEYVESPDRKVFVSMAYDLFAAIDKNGDYFLDPVGNEADAFRENFLCLCQLTGGKVTDAPFQAVKLTVANPNSYCGDKSEQWFGENAEGYLATAIRENKSK